MKLELRRNELGVLIGYKIVRESEDELEDIERVRDMHFWGHLGEIKYDGRKSDGRKSAPDSDDTVELMFIGENFKNSV